MIYIRTDGNAEIGTGHIMRCLSIAATVRRSGGECTFITADNNMKSQLDEQGFSVICLDSTWNNLDKETERMERLVSENKIERLLIDSYFVTSDYLTRLNKLTYVIYMDDLDAFIYPCSELINYNIYADKLGYPARYPHTKLLLGPKHAPLREEFYGIPLRQVNETVKSLLITIGGVDSFSIAGQIVERVKKHKKLSHLHCILVAGRFNNHMEILKEIAVRYNGVTVHKNVENMAELMLECDLAVSAGGSTLYELCACSTPSVVFSVADNQRMAVSAFSEGYMLGCGDYRDGEEECLKLIISNLVSLVDDRKLQSKLSAKCWELLGNKLH